MEISFISVNYKTFRVVLSLVINTCLTICFLRCCFPQIFRSTLQCMVTMTINVSLRFIRLCSSGTNYHQTRCGLCYETTPRLYNSQNLFIMLENIKRGFPTHHQMLFNIHEIIFRTIFNHLHIRNITAHVTGLRKTFIPSQRKH